MYFTERERKKEISSWYLRPCGVPAFLKRLMMKLSNSGMSSLESNSCVRVFRCAGFYREIPSILFFTLWFLIFGHKIIFFVLNQYMCFPPLTGQMYQQYQAPGGYPPPAGPQQQYGMQYPGNFNFAYLTKTLWFLSVCCMNILARFIIVLMMSYPVFFQLVIPPNLELLRLLPLNSSFRITPPLPPKLLVLLAPPLDFLVNHNLLLPKDQPSTHPEHFHIKTTHPSLQGDISPALDTPHRPALPLPPGVPTPMPETAPLMARATPSQVLGTGKGPLTSPQHLWEFNLASLQHISPRISVFDNLISCLFVLWVYVDECAWVQEWASEMIVCVFAHTGDQTALDSSVCVCCVREDMRLVCILFYHRSPCWCYFVINRV